MTGRSNSATTSRRMWMLSASSARRWSSRRSVVTSGDKATVDILVRGTPRAVALRVEAAFRSACRKNKKAREGVPGFDLSVFFRVFSGGHPNSWTVSAGTSGVLIQQQAHGQQVGENTLRELYLKSREGGLPGRRRGVPDLRSTRVS